jgi:DNA-binding NtrC family response regulator
MNGTPDVRRLGRGTPRPVAVHRARSRITVVRGPSSGLEVILDGAICTIGSDPGADVPISDPEVCPHHVDIALGDRGFLLTDLESRSGAHVGGIRIERVYLRPGAVVEVGASAFRFDLTGDAVLVALHDGERLGELVGRSVVMRETMALVARLGAADGPVLVTGEPGSEVDRAAAALHSTSDRVTRTLERIDCAKAPPDLDRLLFGSEANGEPTEGLLDRTAGGTLLLRNIDAFPLDLQPALVRLFDQGTFRRVGGRRELICRTRVLASTTASLQAGVHAGHLRSDLVVRLLRQRVVLAPLRHRMEDLRMLVGAIVADEVPHAAPMVPALLRVLSGYDWPGNYQELHDVVTGALTAAPARSRPSAPGMPAVATPPGTAKEHTTRSLRAPSSTRVSLIEARRRWSAAAEEAYLAGLVLSTNHDLDECAEIAGVSKRALQRLLAKHKLG